MTIIINTIYFMLIILNILLISCKNGILNFQNEINLKIKGPGIQYIICNENIDEYTFKTNYPSKL